MWRIFSILVPKFALFVAEKSEYRNPKSETNPNDRKSQIQNRLQDDSRSRIRRTTGGQDGLENLNIRYTVLF
jgi:hypothetical protein